MKTFGLGVLAAFSLGGFADASVTFFTDEVAFDAALAAAGKISKGTEDFEQALLPLPPNDFLFLDDPLNINNLQGAFNTGDFIDNLTFQSNTNGTPPLNDPGVNGPNPLGVDGLRLMGPVFGQGPNVGLVSPFGNESFDILSGPPAGDNHTALGMHVFSFSTLTVPVEVRVFDKLEQQIGLISIQTNVSGSFLGILTTSGETIGRVNIWAVNGNAEGIYDIQAYLVPAPAALALLGLAGLMGARRRRSR